eukprot:symbB.v1.2.018843.t1/scaffold1518.1/size114122/8
MVEHIVLQPQLWSSDSLKEFYQNKKKVSLKEETWFGHLMLLIMELAFTGPVPVGDLRVTRVPQVPASYSRATLVEEMGLKACQTCQASCGGSEPKILAAAVLLVGCTARRARRASLLPRGSHGRHGGQSKQRVQRNRVATTPRRGQLMDKVQQKAEEEHENGAKAKMAGNAGKEDKLRSGTAAASSLQAASAHRRVNKDEPHHFVTVISSTSATASAQHLQILPDVPAISSYPRIAMLCFALGVAVLVTHDLFVDGHEAAYVEMERAAERHRPSCGGFAWCDVSLPLEKRVELLVDELTPEEKIAQLGNDLFGGVPAIERIGLDKYNYIREAAHGVLLRGGRPHATSFPQVIAMAASFNRSLFRLVGEAVGREARYMQDVGIMWGDFLGRYGGLVLQFNVNLFRDPRWGRGQETPGESPELTSAFAEEYVQGIQNPLPGRSTPQAGASCKHFAAYSFEGGPTLLNRTESMRHTLPGQSNLSRHNEDAVVSRRDFAESYAKPFKACAKAKAMGVMCAYNQVNGVPSCGNKRMLKTFLREKWGFDGVVVTDCDSISDMYALQDFKSSPAETIKAALAAGTDVACSPGFFKKYATPAMNPLLTEAVKDAMRVRFRLGEFDPPPRVPSWPVVSRGHSELALEAALQSAVLLKNDGRLPLQRNLRLAVLGPLRNATEELLGNYQAWPMVVPACSPAAPSSRLGLYM